MNEFDPYHTWLGIPPEEQPPNHYRLLGITLFESEGEVIRNAADQRMAYLKTFGTGQHSGLSQKLLNEVSAAKVCLLNEAKKHAYDDELRKQTAQNRANPPPAAPPSSPAGPEREGDSARSQVVVDATRPARLRSRRYPLAGSKWAKPAVLALLLFIVLVCVASPLLFHMSEKPPVNPDEHGNGNGGVVKRDEETTEPGAGEINKPKSPVHHALRFNGTDSFLEIPTLLYDGSHPITAEAIVRPDLELEDGAIIATTERAGFAVCATPEHWRFEMHNERQYVRALSDGPPKLNKSAHVAGVFDGRQLFLFVDGKKQGSTPKLGGVFKASRFPITIGASPSGESLCDYPFKGDVRQVRLSRIARYSADFEPPSEFTADEDTILLLRLDEGKGPTVRDTSADNHIGTIHSSEWIVIPTGDDRTSGGEYCLEGTCPPNAVLHEQTGRFLLDPTMEDVGRYQVTIKGPGSIADTESTQDVEMSPRFVLQGGCIDVHVENAANNVITFRLRVSALSQSHEVGVFNDIMSAARRKKQALKLDLRGKGMTDCPFVGHLTHLRWLDWSDSGMTIFPSELGWLRELEELDLSGNNLGAVRAEIGHLKRLKVVDLSENSLTGLPNEIGWLKELEYLYLRNNEITGLPRQIAGCNKLKILDLRGNPISGGEKRWLTSTLRSYARQVKTLVD